MQKFDYRKLIPYFTGEFTFKQIARKFRIKRQQVASFYTRRKHLYNLKYKKEKYKKPIVNTRDYHTYTEKEIIMIIKAIREGVKPIELHKHMGMDYERLRSKYYSVKRRLENVKK